MVIRPPQLAGHLAWVASLVFLIGCGPSARQGVVVSGTVSLENDTPLSGAVITFEPQPGTAGPNASAPVFDGRFEITADAGLAPGGYVVRIAMMPPELLNALPEAQRASLPKQGSVIAPQFDGNSQLKCELPTESGEPLTYRIQFLRSRSSRT